MYIRTITDDHAELARESIFARKLTVVENPMTLRYAETKELVDLAKEKNYS